MVLYVSVHRGQSILFARLVCGLVILILIFLHDVEIVDKFIKLTLAERRPQIYHEGDRDHIEDI